MKRLNDEELSLITGGEAITIATVMAILNRNNIPKRTKGGIYAIPEQEVITRYKNGESCQVIAASFKVTFHTISNILEKNNIARDNKYKNINLNENYFEKIDSSDKAYFLGFMLTDGNISLNENTIRLSLSSKDEEILNIFKKKQAMKIKFVLEKMKSIAKELFN